jgi:prepilin-type processing-associated H-X9-DG protein
VNDQPHGVMYCPEAPDNIGFPQQPRSSPYVGTAFHAWANISPVGSFYHEGSYGMNAWLSALRPGESTPLGDEGTRELYLALPAKESSTIPLFGDCASEVAWPQQTDTPPENLRAPIPTTGNLGLEHRGLRKFCMARHGRAINIVFLDGHARTVPLSELWKL